MLNAAITQFKLGDDGIIRFQPQASNPLPGEPFARIVKGAKILEPGIEVTNAAGQDKDAVENFMKEWVKTHIRTVLEPLVALEQTEGMAEPVKGICENLYNALGIMPREQVEKLTAALDADMRQVLRSKHVRLGPVLVFLPALNKPAGVRLRGLLWSLWNNRALPPTLPHDGVVSVKVDSSVDPYYYRAIGYPVYGPRAIRIDMLDRVISAVYDGAKDGKFQAQHQMAEWLGCQITDLYEVLIAMGHKKIHDPLDNKKEEEAAAPAAVEEAKPAEEKPVEETAKPAKPELATFALKKGKAFQKREEKSKEEKSKSDSRPARPNKPRADKKKDKKPERPRMISAEAKSNPEDSPFAILGQLKKVKDGKS